MLARIPDGLSFLDDVVTATFHSFRLRLIIWGVRSLSATMGSSGVGISRWMQCSAVRFANIDDCFTNTRYFVGQAMLNSIRGPPTPV